jgi:heptose-I-phosphate ethanolaminephosphotransferase
MSLYGAKSKTTPRLDDRTDLILYNNVVSPYSSTINSVLTILTQTNLEKKIDILDIFHSSGFKIFWISNQSPIGV